MDSFNSKHLPLNHRETLTPLSFSNVVRALGQQLPGASNAVLNRLNNPFLNVLFNNPAKFQDQSGVVELTPGMFGPSLNMQGYGPDAVRAQIDIGNRSVSVGKGPFDATFGYGNAPIPRGEGYGSTMQEMVSPPSDSYWARLGFKFPAPVVAKPDDTIETEHIPAPLTPAQQFLEESLNKYKQENPDLVS